MHVHMIAAHGQRLMMLIMMLIDVHLRVYYFSRAPTTAP